MKKLGRYLVEALEAEGVRHVFGIPGIHNLELYRGLEDARLRHVTGRHEQGLGFMADGYARVSGEPGVCFTISGPGVSNIATAMGQAYADSIALLVIAFLHELPDQRGLASTVAAASYAISEPQQLPEALARAFALFRSARPRPVYIEIALDVLAADASALALPQPARAQPPLADADALQAAASLLREATRPLILAGGGAIRAATALRALAERLAAPVVMTINGRGLLGPSHPLAVAASASLASVRELIAAADVVLAVGTEIGPTDYDMYGLSEFPAPRNLIRIDIDAAQLTRNATPRIALCGDAAQTLQRLLQFPLGDAAARLPQAQTAAAHTRAQALGALTPVMRQQIGLLELMRDSVPDAVFVGDSTQLVYSGNLVFDAASPGSWFNSATGYGTLGYALPASTGASLAAPKRPILCLIGDGGLQFTLAELAVLRETDAWTAIILWNNYGYGEIRAAMLAAGIEPLGVDVQPPDFERIAAAYGYAHQRIANAQQLRRALTAFAAKRQVLVLELEASSFDAIVLDK